MISLNSFLFSSINILIILSLTIYIFSFFYHEIAKWARLIAGFTALFSITFFLSSNYYSDFSEYLLWLKNPDLFLDHRDFIFAYLMKFANAFFDSEQGLKILIFLALTFLIIFLSTNRFTMFFPIVTNPRFMELILNSFRGGISLGLLTIASSLYRQHPLKSIFLVCICFGMHFYLSIIVIAIFFLSRIINLRIAHLALFFGSFIYFFPVNAYEIFFDKISFIIEIYFIGKDNNEYISTVALSGWPKLSGYIFNIMPVLAIMLSNYKRKNENMYKFAILSSAISFLLANYFPAMLRLSGIAFFTALSVKTSKLGTFVILAYSLIQTILILKNFESVL